MLKQHPKVGGSIKAGTVLSPGPGIPTRERVLDHTSFESPEVLEGVSPILKAIYVKE